ncbi:MAG: GntR family transcriptional regulator [Clostridiales Family XIII bacterium]|jgi:DNA-binding GntR family transcriptional regulator|nr:GntR family transcriptional regulator [Clostridiales Family XIII bacterium]
MYFEDLGKSLTIKERVSENIKSQIILGNLKQGSRLKEEELSKAMNVSRAPVREAFYQLENDGFVKIIPRKGVIVLPLSSQYIRDVYELNSILENAALKKSFKNIPIPKLEELEQIFRKHQNNLATIESESEYLELDQSFHFLIVKCCDNQKLLDEWKRLQGLIHWFRTYSLRTITFKDSAQIHLEIIDAIKTKNLQLTTKRLNAHSRWAISYATSEFEK